MGFGVVSFADRGSRDLAERCRNGPQKANSMTDLPVHMPGLRSRTCRPRSGGIAQRSAGPRRQVQVGHGLTLHYIKFEIILRFA